MKMILNITTLALMAVTLSCHTGRESKKLKQDESIPKAILTDSFESYRNSADCSIYAIRIENNIMSIDVSYSGGCEKHEFKLIGSISIQKSLPPQRGVILYHNNNDDSCRSIVEETLKFDITDLAYEGGEIILNIKGWEPSVSYTQSK